MDFPPLPSWPVASEVQISCRTQKVNDAIGKQSATPSKPDKPSFCFGLGFCGGGWFVLLLFLFFFFGRPTGQRLMVA